MPAVKFLARLDLDQIPYLWTAKLMILQTFGNTSGPNAPDHTRSRATLRLDKVVFKAAGHVISKHREVLRNER
jgi:hypothetical protein